MTAAKSRTPASVKDAKAPATPIGQPAVTPLSTQDSLRETMDSISIAFILAFLFRGFLAEAFIIPTGSMAPTLLGRNKDVVCPACNISYVIGASDEMDRAGARLERRIRTSYCPNCRHETNVKSLNAYKGDRILVNKFPYEIGLPQRWDVVVFKFPEDPQTNYIKRLIGLPGEKLMIARGDLFAQTAGDAEYRILRKDDLGKQRALQQLVYNDQHPPRPLLEQGWPERWDAIKEERAPNGLLEYSPDDSGWKADRAARTFSMGATGRGSLRYRHFVPDAVDWAAAQKGNPVRRDPRPQLIADYCGYNGTTDGLNDHSHREANWAGDLTLNAVVEVRSANDGGTLEFELREGLRSYRATIDPKTGRAVLSHSADDLSGDPKERVELTSGETPLKSPGKYRVTFANVDDRLALWVASAGRSLIGDETLLHANYVPPILKGPRPDDLAPASLSAIQVDCTASNLVLERDIYYRAESAFDHSAQEDFRLREGDVTLQELGDDPLRWTDRFEERSRSVSFDQLAPDEFFMLGDNSPKSQDSRLWPNSRRAINRHAVPRSALVGKAFFIYWPHGVPFLNGGQGFPVWKHRVGAPGVENSPEYVFPFYPQFWRMQRIQ